MADWIDLLFKRHGRGDSLASATVLKLQRNLIAAEADVRKGGREALRRSALSRLTTPKFRDYALVVLSVVGRAGDLKTIDALPDSRAVRACRYELRRLP